MLDRLPFKHPVAVDFEFEFGGHASIGGREPIRRTAAAGVHGGEGVAQRADLGAVAWRIRVAAAVPDRADSVLIAYYASAELGCFQALGWPFRPYVLDLFTEFRALTNGRNTPNGACLLGALTCFGLDGIEPTEKQDLRTRILPAARGRRRIAQPFLKYCGSDGPALERLLPVMLPHIDLPRALLRGRFMKAAARIEWNGMPIDTATLGVAAAALGRNSRRSDCRRLIETMACLTAAASAWSDGNGGLSHGIPWPRARKRSSGSERRHLPTDGACLSGRLGHA